MAASLASVFGGNSEIANRLIELIQTSQNPRITAAALDALSRGWPSIDGLNVWLQEAEHSPSVQLRTVASLALHRRGRFGIEGRNALLNALSVPWDAFLGDLQNEIIDALVTDWADDAVLHDTCWAVLNHERSLQFDIFYDKARAILMRLHRYDPRVPRWIQKEIETREYFPFRGMQSGDIMLGEIMGEHENVRATVETWFEQQKSEIVYNTEARLAALIGTDTAKQRMVDMLDVSNRYRFWPVWSLLHGWGIDDPDVAAAMEPLPRLLPEDRQYIAQHIPVIVKSVEEGYRLLMEICELPEVLRTDFVLQGFRALGDKVEDERVVSSIIRHVRNSRNMFNGEAELFDRYYKDTRVRMYASERLNESSPPIVHLASVYEDDVEIANLILRRAAPLATSFRRHIAKQATRRFDDAVLSEVLRHHELETDEHAMIQAIIGHSYQVLTRPSEVPVWVNTLRKKLVATGPDFESRQVSAFASLLAIGHLDVFARARERHNDEPMRINLTDCFRDYSPAVELTAERWEEFESIIGEDMLDRLSRVSDSPIGFWRVFAPYASRSTLLRKRFLEYCQDETNVLESPALVALSRLEPASPILLDCCLRTLTFQNAGTKFTDLDSTRSTLIASKCLASYFPADTSAMQAVFEASNGLLNWGSTLVGLASRWPSHEILDREYKRLVSKARDQELLACADLWLLSVRGNQSQLATAFIRFVTRTASSVWDFPQEALGAFQSRLIREPDFEETLHQLALDNDTASVRASVVRLLASTATTRGLDLTRELLYEERQRTGPPRFALDVTTNRIQLARELMQEVISLGGE